MVTGYVGFLAGRCNFVFRNGQGSKERNGGFRWGFQAPSPGPGQLSLCVVSMAMTTGRGALWEGVEQEQREDGDVEPNNSCRSAWLFWWSGRKILGLRLLWSLCLIMWMHSSPLHPPLSSQPGSAISSEKGKKGGISAIKSRLWIIKIYFEAN